jgi:nitric oxide reductase large subunit
MSYNEPTTQREEAKEKEAWKIAIISTIGFVILGAIIWGFGIGGKY